MGAELYCLFSSPLSSHTKCGQKHSQHSYPRGHTKYSETGYIRLRPTPPTWNIFTIYTIIRTRREQLDNGAKYLPSQDDLIARAVCQQSIPNAKTVCIFVLFESRSKSGVKSYVSIPTPPICIVSISTVLQESISKLHLNTEVQSCKVQYRLKTELKTTNQIPISPLRMSSLVVVHCIYRIQKVPVLVATLRPPAGLTGTSTILSTRCLYREAFADL